MPGSTFTPYLFSCAARSCSTIARISLTSTSRIPFSSLARARRSAGRKCWFRAMTCPSFCRPGTFAISRSRRTSAEVLSGSSNCSSSLGASRAGDKRSTTNIIASRTGGRHVAYVSGTNRETGTIPSTIHSAIVWRKDCPAMLRRIVSIALTRSAREPPFGRKSATMERNFSGVKPRESMTGGESGIGALPLAKL